MILDVHHLRLVEAIAEAGTQTGAAERLFVTQSALSQRLLDLEDRLGGPLFDRTGRRMRPTEAGERVLALARRVLPDLSRGEAEVRALTAGRAGTLRFATACYLSYGWLPPLLSAYGTAFPDVDVRIVPEAADDPRTWLLGRRLDAAIVIDPGPGDQSSVPMDTPAHPDALAIRPLFRDELVALVPAGHAWNERTFVDAADLASQQLFLAGSALDTHKPLGRAFLEASIEPDVTTLPTTTGVAVEMVRAGMGVTVLARWAAAPEQQRGGLTALRVTEAGLFLTWSLALRNENRPVYLDAFATHLERFHPHHSGSTSAVPDAR